MLCSKITHDVYNDLLLQHRLQASVAAALSEGLGLAVAQEALTEDGLFSIDLAVEWKGRWETKP